MQFRKDQSLDLEATSRHIDQALIDSGVDGPRDARLARRERDAEPDEKRRRRRDGAVEVAAGRVPVLPASSRTSTAAAVQVCRDMRSRSARTA
jgi:dihydrodipicolinate synthase/N-acetylneuraminate lyase